MTKETVLQITMNYYPSATGVILTGSQSGNNEVINLSDVDLMVVDARFSVVSSCVIRYQNFVFDYTQIPLNDIENVLMNESFDSKSIFLSMLRNGEILKDDEYAITQKILDRAASLYQELNPLMIEEYNKTLKDLRKIKKDLRNLQHGYRKTLMVNEFVSLITKAELIKLTNWHSTEKHKVDLLYQYNPVFVERLNQILLDSLSESGDSTSTLHGFIDLYLAQPIKKHVPFSFGEFIILDIYYTGITVTNFFTILTEVHNDSLLHSLYSYFYLSPKQYDQIYKHTISLVFKYKAEITIEELIERIKTKIKLHFKGSVISAAPTYLAANRFQKDYLHIFEPIGVHISKMIESSIGSSSNFDLERSLVLGVLFAASISHKLKIDFVDITKLNFYLCNRGLLTKEAQIQIKNPDEYHALIKNVFPLFHRYYLENKVFINDIVSKGVSPEEIDPSKPYAAIISQIDIFLEQWRALNENAIQQSITLNILRNQYKISDPDKSLCFILLMEQIGSLLLLNANQQSFLLFVLTESLNDIRKVTGN